MNEANVSTNPQKDDTVEINLWEIALYLFHWLWLLAVAGLVAGAIAFSYSAFILTPMYTSTTKVYILSKQGNDDKVTLSDTQLANNITKDFKEMIKSRTVVETVIRDLNLSESYGSLAGRISVSNATDTRVVGISVKDADPKKAQMLANSIRDVAGNHIREVMDLEAVNVVDEANLPESPSEPSKKKYTLIGFLIGVVASAAVLILRFYLDDSIKSSDDIEKYLGLSTLASIPVFESEEDAKKKKKKKSRNHQHEPQQQAEV
ncbi:MAG: protein-tyrosine kinase [Lachnospiraceae bacterium]|nr:protein-tyrosine kinase [Lachnospiraceae bacterium]